MITSINDFKKHLNENLLIPRRSKEERNLKLLQTNYRKLCSNEVIEDGLIIDFSYDFPETFDLSKITLKVIDGTVTINLDHIPKWLENITINGDFYCGGSLSRLTTLRYCPKIVNGVFSCRNNNLTSLENCPIIVKGYFDCSNNKIGSLEHCPTVDNKGFNCANNNLTSLEYAPTTIDGDFACNHNKLTSLEYCPTTVNGLFICYSNINIFQPEEIRSVCNAAGSINY